MSSDGPQTKAEYAAAQLREQILSGDLPPGERLRVDLLTEQLGMSPTPIREALRVLQAEGLLTQRPHHGIVVANPSAEDFEEICRLRAMLEPYAARLAVARLDAAALAELDTVHEAYLAAVDSDNRRAALALNRQWHWLIYRASASPRLLDLIERLWNGLPWGMIGDLPSRVQRSASEHVAIQEAIHRRDGDTVAELLRKHIGGGEELVAHLRSLERRGSR